MEKNSTRYFLLVSLAIVGMFLFNAWQKEVNIKTENIGNHPVLKTKTEQQNNLPHIPDVFEKNENIIINTLNRTEQEKLINIITPIFDVKINPLGGDIVYLELLKYPEKIKGKKGFVLLDQSTERNYIAQSGLLGDYATDSNSNGRVLYKTDNYNYSLSKNNTELLVNLQYRTPTGVKINKIYTFYKDNYTVNVTYLIDNKSDFNFSASMFGRLKRTPPTDQGGGFMGSQRTYTGAAVKTDKVKYKKISFDDMKKEPFQSQIIGGWAAMVEHYFTVAWVPDSTTKHYYQTESLSDGSYAIGYISPPVELSAGETKELSSSLYLGPEITEILRDVSPGLELTVDYGVFWVISYPLFLGMKFIHSIVNNWGWSIVLITLFIKLVFYPLSAASYRSMGKMKKLQPRIQNLKEQYGDDKQQFGQAVMKMYKQEKVNPLGGCLPILIQIPVFISLYYVLLESVELRQAPFLFWLQDLSSKDPFYVLPLIMGASMLVQQKLNPAPADPMQAKVMMFMPVFFTFLFLGFPSGLVLYWVVNNVLSILQQWNITRKLDTHRK